MIRVDSSLKLEQVEAAVCRAAQKHSAHVLSVTSFAALLGKEGSGGNAVSFAVCQPSLYSALLSADIRFAIVLPCRIAAIRRKDGVTLEAVSPQEYCRVLDRPDLLHLAAPLETFLAGLIEDTAHPSAVSHSHHPAVDGALGAQENQVSMRASIPQRIDCRGTKVEEIAGTGKIDSPGG